MPSFETPCCPYSTQDVGRNLPWKTQNRRLRNLFAPIPISGNFNLSSILSYEFTAVFCLVAQRLRWLNIVLAVCDYMSFAKSWQEKGCSSQAETWQVKNILMKDFDWQVKFDVFVVSMATWTIEYNLKISLLLSLHQNCSLDFPINLYTAYYY